MSGCYWAVAVALLTSGNLLAATHWLPSNAQVDEVVADTSMVAPRHRNVQPLRAQIPFRNFRYPHVNSAEDVTFIADDFARKAYQHGIYRSFTAQNDISALVVFDQPVAPGSPDKFDYIRGLQMDGGDDFVFNATITTSGRGLFYWSDGNIKTIARTRVTALPNRGMPLTDVGYGALKNGRIFYQTDDNVGTAYLSVQSFSDNSRTLSHISSTPAAGQIPLPGGHLKWEPLAPLSSPRYALAAATAPDGSIFAIGGADGSSASAVVEVYRPESKQWHAAPSLPRLRYRLAAATGGDGRIYAIGGSDPGGEGAFLSSVLALTPGADQWVAVAAMSVGRQLLAATAGADGRIYAVGGHNGGALNLLEIYDPARGQWTTGAPMPTPRYDMGVALGGDGRIYAIGGSGDGVFNVLDVVEAYSPATNSWATVAPLPSRRALVDAAAGADGRIYAIGGCELVTDAAGNPVDCVDSKRVDVYSPQENVWQTLSPTIVAHREGAATADGKSIFAIGGHTEVVESAQVPLPQPDTMPPAITVSANSAMLWPPNGRLVPVTVSGTVADEPGGSGVNLGSTAYVVMDEYGQIQPRGSLTLGAGGSYTFTVALEASRRGNDRDGRHYTIAVSAKDNAGNLGVASTIVTVPHDQGQ